MKKAIQKVHIKDANGNLLYTRLIDDGSLAIGFASGFGFVDRLEVDRNNWQICEGWPKTLLGDE